MRNTVRFKLPEQFDEAVHFCGCPEEVENIFNIEFSCKGGRFLSDITDDDQFHDTWKGELDITKIRFGGKIFSECVLQFTYNDDDLTQQFTNIKITHKK